MSLPVSVPRWELAAENIAVKIRWLGLVLGYLYVNTTPPFDHQPALNAILALGLCFTVLDTWSSLRGQVFLGRLPLVVSTLEAVFIGMLCYYHGGLTSRFQYYYFPSLICCAIRHSALVTYVTCALHCLSLTVLYLASPADRQQPFALVLMIIILWWVTWASSALARLLMRVSDSLTALNSALRENQTHLEAHIAERTRQLQEAQAQLLHQEKMAAFGLLAAGIAHEVGNPLTSVSSIVQMLQRRDVDPYVQEKLQLAGEQVKRIQSILRDLVNFSRPASTERTRLIVKDVIDEAVSVARYYSGAKSRKVTIDVPHDLPTVYLGRGPLVQVFLNLVLNAIDATPKGGAIAITAAERGSEVIVEVADDGHGVSPADREKLFQPYFTTKKHGTGLGLFVTKKLVGDLGGAIAVLDRPGRGTVFQVRLPAEPYALKDYHRLTDHSRSYAGVASDSGR